MDARELLKSDYMDAVSFSGRKITKTISLVEKRTFEDERRKDELGNPQVVDKGVVHFGDVKAGMPNKWIMNVTTTKCMIAMFGHETDEWIGKRVTLYPEHESRSESGLAIRVWGSPDIEADIQYELKLARKKPRKLVLHKTAAAAPKREREPGED